MSTTSALETLHPAGEEDRGCRLETLGGAVSVERTDEALTPYGGLAAWSAFVGRMGTFERLAESCPVERTSPNAAPVREVLHSFSLTVLIEGRRFRHVGWVQDEVGVAAVLGLERVRGEDALPRLAKGLSVDKDSLLSKGVDAFWLRNIIDEFIERTQARARELNDPALPPSAFANQKEALVEAFH